MLKLDVVFAKAEGTITFLKAVAAVTLQKAVATITFGQFIIFKEFTNLATAIDVLTTNTNKILSNNFLVTDLHALSVVKTRSDTFSLSDDTFITLSLVKNDVALVQDAPFVAVSKHLIDGFLVNDTTVVLSLTKFITDNASVTDDFDGEASLLDDQVMSFTKVRSNLATIIDTTSIRPTKVFSDNSAITDSGILRGQGYCDFDYFADDFTGYSQTI